MNDNQDWRTVYDFWFPSGLKDADLSTHARQQEWWFRGGANPELAPFAPLVEAAASAGLDHWTASARGRLSLIITLDQFPRGLFAGTPEAFAYDPRALRIAEEGLDGGHYDALTFPWERMFVLVALVHAEGPDHLARADRAVALSEHLASEVPSRLRPLYDFSLSQARSHREVIFRFGRHPHRNAILGRVSTPEEQAYLEKGELVHTRPLPDF